MYGNDLETLTIIRDLASVGLGNADPAVALAEVRGFCRAKAPANLPDYMSQVDELMVFCLDIAVRENAGLAELGQIAGAVGIVLFSEQRRVDLDKQRAAEKKGAQA